jgi:CelD/BcsL family acetyltransferase involved in cellulose biosynthesis
VAELRVERRNTWAAGWNELLEKSAADTVFLTEEWLTSWWDAYRGSRELVLLYCFDGDELVGIAPFCLVPVRTELQVSLSVLRIVGDGTFDSDHLDFISAPGQEVRVVRAVFDWLTSNGHVWDLLELGSVRETSPTMVAIAHELGARGWRSRSRTEDHAIISLPDTWEKYLAQLSSQMRSSVRRKERSLVAEHAVVFTLCEREADIPRYLEQLFLMHADRWQARGQRGSFENDGRRALYDAIARRALARGWLHLGLLEVDGEPAAVEFGLCYHRRHVFLQSGFATKLGPLSVGVVCKSHVLRSLIAKGVRSYDFLHGGDAYKQKWGTQNATHRQLRAARPRSVGAAFISVRDLVARGKAWLYSRVPESMAAPLRTVFRKLRPYRDGFVEKP